jgi:hypothetical protein
MKYLAIYFPSFPVFCAGLRRVPAASAVTLLYKRRYQNAPRGAYKLFIRNKNQAVLCHFL